MQISLKQRSVGATYHVARFPTTGAWITALKWTNGTGNCRGDRRSVSTRPKGCVGGQCLRALRALRDLSCRPPKRKKCRGDRRSVSTRPIWSPAFRLPDKPCGEQNRPKYPPDNKKMTPFCLPNHNIKTSYVGATYHVARNHMSKRQRATDGLCLRALLCRPLSG